jgi:integrase
MGRKAERTVEFTDKSIRARLRDGTGQPQQEWRVQGVDGLVLLTQPTGSGAFYYFYRNELGQPRKLRLGAYVPESEWARHKDAKPEHRPLTLAEARKRAEQQRHAVEDGSDPYAELKAEMTEAKTTLTFKELAERFLVEAKLKATTRRAYRYCLAKDAYPIIGNIAANKVTPDHILKICKRIEATGARTQSDHTRTTISGCYRWGLSERLVKANPCKEIGRRAPKVARERVPTDNELAALWAATERKGAKLSTAMRYIVKLGILVGQRRSEICGARVSELQLEGNAPMWTIPGDVNKRGKIIEGRTKNGRAQHVPLSAQAAALFREAIATCSKGEFVFPADLSKVKIDKEPNTPHINPDSVSRAVARLREAAGADDIGIHDMRSAISHWLKDQGVSREVRDLVLNHKDPSVTEAHYSQGARMPKQVRQAMEAWSAHVWEITGQRAGETNVVAMKRA